MNQILGRYAGRLREVKRKTAVSGAPSVVTIQRRRRTIAALPRGYELAVSCRTIVRVGPASQSGARVIAQA